MESNNFAMKEWHIEHVEKVVIRFAQGLPSDASSFEKRNYKKYGTISYVSKQIEYDMKHGVESAEVLQVFRKIRLDKKYGKLRSDANAVARLQDLEDLLSGAQVLSDDRFLWHRNAYKGR